MLDSLWRAKRTNSGPNWAIEESKSPGKSKIEAESKEERSQRKDVNKVLQEIVSREEPHSDFI